jgi:hypothetical protein
LEPKRERGGIVVEELHGDGDMGVKEEAVGVKDKAVGVGIEFN